MRVQKKDLFAFTLLLAIACLTIAGAANAQTPKPSPSPEAAVEDTSNYRITSTVEIGVRGLDVNGDINKFRSDLNYKPGVRLFDSSFMIEDRTNGTKLFDKLLVTTTGFGADPQGAFRMDMEAKGVYRLDANVRNVRYFNSLKKIAFNEHTAATQHNFGDFDLTLFPENAKLRGRLGYSFNRTTGDGGFTTRAFSDEFGVQSNIRSSSQDLRAGIEGTLLGFNLGFNYGHRIFNDKTSYLINGLNLGNNPTNNPRLFTFQRTYPVKGTTDFGHFYAQRTFAQKLDFSARFIYSESNSKFTLEESQTGRDNSNNIIDQDFFTSNGDSKRPQSRGDIGVTWRVTEDFRISDTFTYDQFNIGGGNVFLETRLGRTPAGAALAPFFSNTLSDRITSYRRVMNLLEADYQLNKRVAFNVGYRYSHRRVRLGGFDKTLPAGTVAPVEEEDVTNNTNSFIAGTRVKPLKNWTIYADFEKGNADNVFTRLANNDFTNFRIRSRANFNKFSFNASAITKDNNDPSRSITDATLNFSARTKNRMYTASFDWTPRADYSFSTGYTFQHLTSVADIRLPINGVYVFGISQYFIRDNYFFFDVSARPIRRVALFASYRISDDRGQGSRVSTRLQDIITSYPMKYQSPEVRLAVRLTRYMDWNVGYQYYDYKEKFPNAQNYSAHLPYTSLRFYFGRSSVDR